MHAPNYVNFMYVTCIHKHTQLFSLICTNIMTPISSLDKPQLRKAKHLAWAHKETNWWAEFGMQI